MKHAKPLLWLVAFDQRPFHYPPQGLLVTAQAAKTAGWETRVTQFGLDEWERYETELRRLEPTALGMSLFAGPRLSAVTRASRMAGTMGIPVVWGGPLAATAPTVCAQADIADLVVTGRSELDPSGWLSALAGKTPGSGTEIYEAATCPLSDRFDPFYPDPTLLDDPESFTIPRPPFAAVGVVSLSRGCRRRCAFCAAPVVSGGRSRYEPKQVLAAVRFWRQRTAIDVVEFGDDELLDPRYDVRSLVEEIGLPYYAQLHVRTVTEELADWLVESGCQGVKLGAESGSDRLLASIRKGCRADDIASAVQRLSARGILTVSTFIAGLPGEQAADLAATMELAQAMAATSPRALVRFAHFTPYPGTNLWQPSLDLGFQPPARLEDWSRLDTAGAQVPWVPKRDMDALVNRLNERFYLQRIHSLARARA